jgi:hypothetical protein
MTVLVHNCENCDNQFKLTYDKDVCDCDPIHCPFCGEYLLVDESDCDDDEAI